MEVYSGDSYMEELLKAKNQLSTPARKRSLAEITNSPPRSSPLKMMTPASSKKRSSTHLRTSNHLSAKKRSAHKPSFMAAISKLATPSKRQVEKMEEKDKTHELETRYLSELANKELSCASAQRESSRLENENANLLAENSKLKRRAEHLEKEVHELTLKSNTESQLHPQVVPKEIQTLQEKVLKLREQKAELKQRLKEASQQTHKLCHELTVATSKNWKDFCSSQDTEPKERPAKRQKTMAARPIFRSLVDIE